MVSGRIGYERLSKDKSLRGINVAIQRDEIDEFAVDTGEPIDQHFCDNDISASEFSTKARKDYERLLDCIQANEVCEIIVTEVPRLARKTEEAIELITFAKVTSLRYIKTTDGMVYDLTTPRGRKSFRDAVSDAEFESDQTSTRQHRKKNKQAEAGRYHGGQRRYGYEGAIYDKTVEEAEKTNLPRILMNPGRIGIALVDSEVEVLTEAHRRIIAGERELDVIRDFNTRGIPANSGGKWQAGTLMAVLLKRSRYAFDEFPGAGIRAHKGKEYKALWPAIFPKEAYEQLRAAQLRNRTSRSGKNGKRGPSRSYFSFVKCECGGVAYGNGRTLASGTYQRRYRCRKYNNFGEAVACGNVYRSADALEALVREIVIYRFNSPEVARLLAPTENHESVGDLVEQLSVLRLRRKQIVQERALGEMDRDDFFLAKETLEEAISKTQAELNKLQSSAATKILPVDGQIAEAWDNGSMGYRDTIARLFIKEVIIKKSSGKFSRWNTYKFNPDDVEVVLTA